MDSTDDIHVLVPFDDSDRAVDALEYACETFPDSSITVLHVLDPGEFYAATGIEGGFVTNYDEIRSNYESRAERVLEDARAQAGDHGIEVNTEILIGRVSRSIIEYTDDADVDHVVIGSHGRTGASRVLLGSVAESVARRSSVPVTIVR